MNSKGTITKVEEIQYKSLAHNCRVKFCGIEGEHVPTHEVLGYTPRGVVFCFYTSRPELFAVDTECEVWGPGKGSNGLRFFMTAYEGVTINGRTIFLKESLGAA